MSSAIEYVIGLMDHQAVEQFIERLCAFGLDEWLRVAASVTHETSSGGEARAALDQVVAQHGLGVDAWSVGDDVETAFEYSLGVTGDTLSPRVCDSLRLAREAADTAALAVFVRPLLTEEQFESLYRPFSSMIPQRDAGRPSCRPASRLPVSLPSRPARRWRRGSA